MAVLPSALEGGVEMLCVWRGDVTREEKLAADVSAAEISETAETGWHCSKVPSFSEKCCFWERQSTSIPGKILPALHQSLSCPSASASSFSAKCTCPLKERGIFTGFLWPAIYHGYQRMHRHWWSIKTWSAGHHHNSKNASACNSEDTTISCIIKLYVKIIRCVSTQALKIKPAAFV